MLHRRFRCCTGRASRCGIQVPTATFGGRGLSLSVTTIILAASALQQQQQSGVDAFSPRSAATSTIRVNPRPRSSVVLSSASAKESRKQDGGQTNTGTMSQLLLDNTVIADEDGIGQQQHPTSTAAADSLLDEEFLSFLTSGDDNVLTAVGLPEDCANNIVEIDTHELANIDRNAQKKAAGVGAVEVEEKAAVATTTTTRAAAVTEEEAPSVSKIIKFAIPAIGVWLCGPILSLIDTSAVGLLSGTAQQAALNPAVAISDYTNLLLAFLYTATTNLSASARAADNANIANGSGGDSSPSKTTRTLITALQLSGYVGTAVGAALVLSSKFLVTTMLGTDAIIDPEVMTAALTYVRIRALGVPAAAVIGAAQSSCLGMRDIRSPLYVLAAAAVVNFVGDVLFVGCSHPLLGGAAGAAWATTFSQYAALGLFVKWLRSPGGKKKDNSKVVVESLTKADDEHPSSSSSTINISDAILELTGQYGSRGAGRRAKFRRALQSLRMSSSSTDAGSDDVKPRRSRLFGRRFASTSPSDQSGARDDDTFSARGFLENKMRKRDLFQLPSSESAKEFLPYVLPVTTTSIGRVSSYAAMAHVVASSLGTAAMAAQQIVLSLFYCLTPIADSLGLTAQSFVPGIHSQSKDSPHRSEAIRRTTANFYKAGAIFSAAMVGAVATIPVFSKFFTSDPAVVGMVNSVAPFLAVFFASHGIFSASEGVLLGQKDLGFLGKSYAAFFAVVPALMLQVKRAALSGTRAVDLTSVWGVFVCYQLFRSVMWGLRLLQLQRRVDSDSEAAALRA